jgi:hypothetical protein
MSKDTREHGSPLGEPHRSCFTEMAKTWIMSFSIYSGGGKCFSSNLIGSSVPDILALFTSGQKQNGFLFRSGYGTSKFLY